MIVPNPTSFSSSGGGFQGDSILSLNSALFMRMLSGLRAVFLIREIDTSFQVKIITPCCDQYQSKSIIIRTEEIA